MSREAMQQALEALEWGSGTYDRRNAAITALRAALAEPEQEPIGHADLGINNIYIFSALEPRVIPVGRTPLYTAPTPRKPLTDEEIEWAIEGWWRDDLKMKYTEFARAIERAHGITGEQT